MAANQNHSEDATTPEVEDMLWEIAFALHLTEVIKKHMRAERNGTPDRRRRPDLSTVLCRGVRSEREQ